MGFSETTTEQPTHYERLGIQVSASNGDIRRAYRELSRQYHPDTTHLPALLATQRFLILNEAYATLSNPERRLHYDRSIGYSSISMVRSIPSLYSTPSQSSSSPRNNPKNNLRNPVAKPHTDFDPQFSAYLDAEDRHLSPGEQFALFLMGATFVGCLGLVILLSVFKA
jgi:curved DNA-binding protein CbpA